MQFTQEIKDSFLQVVAVKFAGMKFGPDNVPSNEEMIAAINVTLQTQLDEVITKQIETEERLKVEATVQNAIARYLLTY